MKKRKSVKRVVLLVLSAILIFSNVGVLAEEINTPNTLPTIDESVIDKATIGESATEPIVQPYADKNFFIWCPQGEFTQAYNSSSADGERLTVTITGIGNNGGGVMVRVFNSADASSTDWYLRINESHVFSITKGAAYSVYIKTNVDGNVSGNVHSF